MNPIERPRYAVEVSGQVATLAVDAPDWPALLTVAALALSDLVVPIGRFETWTARRVSARGRTASETLERWLESALADWRAGGFLPSLVEVETAEPLRAAGIFRGGRLDPDEPRPATNPGDVVRGSVEVTAGSPSAPWRARFSVTLG